MEKIFKFVLVIFLPLISLIIAIFTLSDYGINWDEPYHYRRGQAFLHYYLTGEKEYKGMSKYPPLKGTSDSGDFRNSDKLFEEVQKNPSLSDPLFRRSYYQDDAWNGEYFIDVENSYGHPALNGILASLTNNIFYQKLGILGDLEAYHLFIILTVSLVTFFTAIFMWKEFGIIESVISSLALSTYPLFLGEQHFNIKDPVVASFYTLTLITSYLFIKKQKYFWGILAVIFFAFGLSTKFNIVFISIPILVWLILYFYQNRNFPKFIKKFWPILILAPILVFAIFVGSFPTLWKNPTGGAKRVLDFYLEVGYSAPSQPAKYYLFNFFNTYPLIWIFYTTPVVTLFFAFSSLFFGKRLFRNKTFSLLLILCLITIIGRISFFGALSYGGIRLIMEYIPVLAMLGGITAGFIYQKLKKINVSVFLLIIIFAYVPIILKLISIHPNENVYFNEFAGGLAGAKEKQINSWGNSNGNAYYPAVLWLNENAEPNARLTLPVGSTNNIPRFKLRKDIAVSWDYWSGPRQEGEYVLELTYDYPPMSWYSLTYLNNVLQPLYEVMVDGVPLAKVWKNSPESVKNKYRQDKIIPAVISRQEKYLEITLPEPAEIMQLQLIQPLQNCRAVTTGYLETSPDGKQWTREAEDIARDQLKHAQLKKLEPQSNFYFVAREAKSIRIRPENSDSCLLRATAAKISVLEGR